MTQSFSNATSLFSSLFNSQKTLSLLGDRYAECVWRDGWLVGMQKRKANEADPYLGTPPAGTQLKGIDGAMFDVIPTSRIRLHQLHADSIEALGLTAVVAAYLGAAKDDADLKKRQTTDIFHPQHRETYEELIAVNTRFGADNKASAVIAVRYLAVDTKRDMTYEQMAAFIKNLLAGDEAAHAERLQEAVHDGWLAKAVFFQEENNPDFLPYLYLAGDRAAIDAYVVRPVLSQHAQDLLNGDINNVLQEANN
jgi:hypothetical protein